jgi:hypothetical protein
MTYSTTRRIQRKRDLDRKQWAAIDKIAFDTLVEGTGEGQATIYFGEAFEKIPHFTWSAIASTETAYPTAEAWGYPHKDNGGLGPLDFTPSVTLSAWTGTFSGDQDVEGITGADGQFAVRFTPTAGNCEGIRLTVRNIGSPTDNLQVKLYEGTLDTATPGTLLATSTVLNADLPTTWTTVDFLFATPPTLTAAVHSFVVSRTGSRDASNYWGVRTTPTTSPAGTEKMVTTSGMRRIRITTSTRRMRLRSGVSCLMVGLRSWACLRIRISQRGWRLDTTASIQGLRRMNRISG